MESHASSNEGLSGVDGELAELLAELAAKLQAGEQVDLEEYVRSHAEYARRLEQLLPAMMTLADMGFTQSSVFSPQKSAPDASQVVSGDIGDFSIVRELGRGGMGVVFEAEQSSLGRRVALKILPFAALLHEAQLKRFATEATAAARLQHDNIVQVYSVGCERGIHYYSMQLIDGPSLAQVIAELRHEQHPGDKDQQESADTVIAKQADVLTRDDDGGHYRAVARIGREAAVALHYAHENDVLHRDIKPSNLLLDKSGHLWIADFGLARVEDESQLTRTGDILGTLHYMSPEQATGDRLDAQSDVYSLGATLYELATLKPVFDNADRREVIKQVVAGSPVAPHQIDSRIPRPLSYVISKSIARRLDERYQSAQEMADDLGRFLDGEAVKAKPPTLLRLARVWSRRHRVVSTAIAGLLIVALLIPFTTHYFFQRIPDDSQTKGNDAASSTEDRVSDTAVASILVGKPAIPNIDDVQDSSVLVVNAATADSITLHWTSGGGSTAGFIVACKEGSMYPKPNLRGATQIDVGNVENYTVGGLKADKAYSFWVCAYDSKGNRSEGVTVQGTTSDGMEWELLGSRHDAEGIATHGAAGRTYVQSTGHLLMPGHQDYLVEGYNLAYLQRWNLDGSLDTTFGNDGKGAFIYDFNDPYDIVYSVAEQDDGKLIIGGCRSPWNSWVARLDANGSLDTTFAIDGMIDLAPGGDNACLKWVTLLSDGSVLAGGVAYFSSPVGDGIWLAKLTPQGVLDTSYGTNGYAIHVLGEGVFAYGEPEVLADDCILLNGTSQGWWVSAVFKFNADGSLDTSFGNNGIAEIDFEANGGEHFNDLIVQSDGKIVAVGGACVGRDGREVTWHGGLPDRATIARFNPNGTTDTTFAIAGGQQFNWMNLITFTDVKELSDGRLVVGGTGNDGLKFHAYMARFDTDGSLDTTFDANGWAEIDVFPNSVFKGFEVIDDDSYFMLGNILEPAAPFMALIRHP